MPPKRARPDGLIAAIAARQHGVVTLTQLIDAGLSRSGARDRVRAGRLHRVHRGVYAVGHAGLSHPGRWMAAVLACGPGAVLSHRPAAELWKLLDPTTGRIDVTVLTRAGRKQRSGLRIHRSHLPTSETTQRHRIAVTTPARTLRDLKRAVEPRLYRRALRQAEYKGLDLTGLHTDGTRSDPEADFLRLCRRHRLPLPAPNRRLGPYTVDFLWREERLVVEVDGWSSHRGHQAFHDDHDRDLFLIARGYTALRFTDRQIRSEPKAVAAAVRRALASR